MDKIEMHRVEKGQRLFGNYKRPEPSERQRNLKKRREELRRVLERLPGPTMSPGMLKELRHYQALLESEIGAFEGR